MSVDTATMPDDVTVMVKLGSSQTPLQPSLLLPDLPGPRSDCIQPAVGQNNPLESF